MGKLFNLKEWLTVADAARHLSIVFGEDVTEADVLRLALDGHLRLSVHFVNNARVRRGQVVGYEDTEWGELPAESVANLPNIPDEAKGKPLPYMKSMNIDGKRFINMEKEVVSIGGVWDLPMIGAEQLDIEHQYQKLTGGPSVTLETLDGAFVEGREGEICQLQEDYDNNEYQAGSKAELKKLTRFFFEMMQLNPTKETAAEAEARLTRYEEDRKEFQEKRKSEPKSEAYYPAGVLPKDSVIVVRTAALRDFEKNLNEDQSKVENTLTTTERKTLLTIVAALCEYSAIDYQGRGAANQIAKLTEEIGAAISDDTVRRWLKRIPETLETGKK